MTTINLDIGKPERVITREEPALPVPQYAPIAPKSVPITPEREPVKVGTRLSDLPAAAYEGREFILERFTEEKVGTVHGLYTR